LASSPRATLSHPSTSYHQNTFSAGSPDTPGPGQHSLPGPSRDERFSTGGYADSLYKNRSQSGSDDSFSSESEDSDTIHERVSKEVDQIIQGEANWHDFFKLMGKQRSAAVVLEEYKIVQGIMDKWVGKPVPSGSLIEKVGVLLCATVGD
jgi:hypothetical protein